MASASHPLDYRYGERVRPIFTEDKWYRYNWEVEAGLARAYSKLGVIRPEVAAVITKAVDLADPEKVRKYEKETEHDLQAMVLALGDACREICKDTNPELGAIAAGKIHLGATSYDIEDNAQLLRIKDAYKIIREQAVIVQDIFVEKALKYRNTPCVGRTHGQHAVPMTFGFKFANYANDMQKEIENMDYQVSRIKGKFSGAIGAYNSSNKVRTLSGEPVNSQKLEDLVGEELGIKMEDISTQVVGRGPYAGLISALAVTGEILEKYSLEIRELSRTEIREVREKMGEKQVGSSTMFWKKNPINTENMGSLVRPLRANTIVAHENVALWHERDLTNSANERIIIYESFGYLDEILKRAEKVTTKLEIFPERMLKNLNLTHGLIVGEEVMTELTNRGMSRQVAHEMLRKIAMELDKNETDFIDKLKTIKEVTDLISAEELNKLRPENYIGEAPDKCIEIAVKLWGKERVREHIEKTEAK